MYTEEARLIASDAAAADTLGYSVAASGDTVVVGAPLADEGADINQGAAYVFVRVGTTWSQQAKLVASDGAAADQFGVSVAIDLNTAVVGANLDDVASASNRGSTYVFLRTGTTWAQQAQLLASDGLAADEFGHSVAISGDTVVVGAPNDRNGSTDGAGSVYTFLRTGTTWAQQQGPIGTSDMAANDNFGWSVAIDNNTVVAGANLDDAAATDQGSAYVLTRSGTTWTQQAKLVASDPAASDNFGQSVAIDLNTAVVGAVGDDTDPSTNDGSAYVFLRTGTTWALQQRLGASDRADSDFFGDSVAISGDTVVAGADGDDVGSTTDQGSAYVFTRSGTTWSQQLKLTASNGAADDRFGGSVGISGDKVVAGAPNTRLSTASAYAFRRLPDPDGDGVPDATDNCPIIGNASQSNHDGDAEGDACDSDDDNDTRADGSDSCPAGEVGWTSNASTDIDGDGCRDAGEDTDDDNDGVDAMAAGDVG